MFLVSCQANPSPSTSSSQTEINTTEQTNLPSNEETSIMNESNSSTESPTTIIWVESGNRPTLDTGGTRTLGIYFEQTDLSKPAFDGQAWDEVGHQIKSRSDLTHILGQSIATRDEAAYIANQVLESELKQGNIIGRLDLELMQVKYDPDKNIWVFGYWENNIELDGSSLHIAVDGESGELIRMWVME